MFFFYFENVVMRGKQESEKSLELLAHLDSDAFRFFFDRFTKDGELTVEAHDFSVVKKAFIEEFQDEEEQQDVIRKATEAKLDEQELLGSLMNMEKLFDHAKFDESAKFGFLRMAVMKLPQLATFAMYRAAADFESLKKAIKDFDNGRKAYDASASRSASSSSIDASKIADMEAKRLMVRPDARVKNMEVKIDSLTEQMASLTLMLKQKVEAATTTDKNPKKTGDDRVCSYCGEAGHIASRCEKNPDKDKKCAHCGKKGHTLENCWARRRDMRKSREEEEKKKSQSVAFVGEEEEEDQSPSEGEEEPKKGGEVNVIVWSDSSEDEDYETDDQIEEEGEVMSLKRDAEGNPISKSRKTVDERTDPDKPQASNAAAAARFPPLEEDVVMVDPKTNKKKKKKSSAKKVPSKKKASRRGTRSESKAALIEKATDYSLVSALASAPTGLSFAQLLRGDAEQAKKDLDKLFSKNGLRVGVLAEGETKESGDKEESCLAVASIKLYGTETHALMDTGAVPNVVSSAIVEHLGIKPEVTKRVVTMASGEKAVVLGKVKDVPVTLGDLIAKMDFIVLENLPFPALIGRPSLTRLGCVLDLKGSKMQLEYGGVKTVLPLVQEYEAPQEKGEETPSEDFTSDSSEEEPLVSSIDDLGEDDEFVLMIGKDLEEDEETYTEKTEEQLEKKLQHLPRKARRKLERIIRKAGVVAESLYDLRPADVPVEHHFELKADEPIYCRGRRVSPKDNKIIWGELQKMLDAGIIVPVTSEWSSPVIIVSKKDGTPRFCVDYRVLNKLMKGDRWPLPKIQEIFDDLLGSCFFTSLDLFSGYWQIRLSKGCRDKTTFVCRFGTFRFEVMPFGLMNAPATFQRLMDRILEELPFVRVYMDDVIIFSKTLEEHLDHVRLVLERIAKHKLKIKVSKCSFAQDEVSLLGHIVGKDGVRTDPKKLEAIQKLEVPKTVTQIRSFLGMAGYYRRFIYGYADIAAPLHEATSKNVRYSWDERKQQAFEKLKEALISPPVLSYPDFEKPFIVETDASKVAVGAVLCQRGEDGKVHPIEYASRTMTAAERGYSACEQESLAVVFALRKFRLYLLSSIPFELITDHDALRFAFTKRDIHGRLARWLDFLAEYDYVTKHRKGRLHVVPDFLSRIEGKVASENEGQDEGDLVTVVQEESEYEPELYEVFWFLKDGTIEKTDPQYRRTIRRRAKSFVLWEGRLFRREGKSVVPVVPIVHREGVLHFLHDSMGHWDANTTRKMVMERYWWPKVGKEVFRYVKTCDACQRMAKLPPYHTALTRPITSLFEVYSIDFSGKLPRTARGFQYLLICVEHLTGWPIVIPTMTATAEVVKDFIGTHIIHPFGIPRTVVSDNAGCFTSLLMTEFCRERGIKWKPVLAYAPMSNGRAERMVKTIKEAVSKLVSDQPLEWDELAGQVAYGYRRRPLGSGHSPFQLMYGILPRMTQDDGRKGELPGSSLADRRAEILMVQGWRATRALRASGGARGEERAARKFVVGDLVLVAHGEYLAKGVLKPAFKSAFYGPCQVVAAHHPRYELVSSTGRRTRKWIHARRIVKYYSREY